MKYLQNNKGFTLLEILIVIVIIGISLGMSSLGYGIIFDARVDSYAEQYHSDLRGMRNDSLGTIDKDYKLVWAQNGQSYDIKDKTTNNLIRTVELSGDLVVKIKQDSMSDYMEFSAYTTSYSDESYRTISFDKSDGSVTSDGAGVYQFSSVSSDDIVTVTIYEATGRVFLDE